ncbi:ECF transporter S component [Proteocatella sphenisci]|uniref:ECF transporter S component n=1 Tax=Proteocatella sphenisci TaxID=181070 RepID=UPI0004BBE393|nr:ECF transporter S component [Proteocatella sphenisci]
MQTNQKYIGSRTATRTMIINGLFIGLTLLATMSINVRLPFMGNGGLIHLGNVPLFIAAIVYGRKTGAIAGAFGMAMFDIISGWTAWAPFTFIICGAIGYVVGVICEKSRGNAYITNSIAIFAACIIKVAGYYIAEVLLYGNPIAPIGSVPGNVMQILVAGIIVIPVVDKLKKIALKGGF